MVSIVFLGFGTYGAASLGGLLKRFGSKAVKLVVTHPEQKGNDASKLVKELALSKGIEVCESFNLLEISAVERIKECEAAFIVSTNWRRKIPSSVFSQARIAALNIHDALLPDFGGLGAEQWVILKGEKKTGVTVHLIDELMDAGSIVLQKAFKISPNDTAEDIVQTQLEIYPKIICKAINGLLSGKLEPRPLPPMAYRRYHSFTYEDRQLRFDCPPEMIMRQIRAFFGRYGHCWIALDGQHYNVIDVTVPEYNFDGIPGRVVTHLSDGVAVATKPCDKTQAAGIVIKKIQDQDGIIIPAWTLLKKNLQLAA